MRTYTDRKGEQVFVSESHLDTAVALKIELQKLSPSLRCSWTQHKKLMMEEGYYDSDTTESYRLLVKDYQRKIGLLSPMVRDVAVRKSTQLESINRVLGDLYEEKRENQLTLNEINKIRKDFHLSKAIAEEIVNEFQNFEVHNLVANKQRFISSHNKAVVVLTDWHIGVVIDDVYGNSFNYEIAKKRIQNYLDQVVIYCKRFQITDVEVVGLGDYVEHQNMRYKQSKEAEFSLARQIRYASELIISFISGLSDHVNVNYSSIPGNHDRLQGNKDIAFDDDNANVIIKGNVEAFIERARSPRLSYTETADAATEINLNMNNKKIKLVHGHLDNGNKKDRLKGHISMQNEFFDCFIYGHLHNYNVQESDHGRMAIGVGCLSGRNLYAKTFNCATDASQFMLVVEGSGTLLPIRIDLQIV